MELISKLIERDINAVRPLNIHVVGDSMIDNNYRAKINRISPECPNIPVLSSEVAGSYHTYPGGAANVCYQLKNFNTSARLFSFLDQESYDVFKKCGLKRFGHVLLPANYYIPRKHRFYDGTKQVGCRWDVEKENYGFAELSFLHNKLSDLWDGFQAEPDIILFSDYDKGMFSKGYSFLKIPKGVPVIVDPKKLPLDRWKGCTVFKPNSKEAIKLSGLTNWRQQCDFFQKTLECEAVVITQAGSGIVGKVKDRYFDYAAKEKVVAKNVTGAGDCFMAIFGLALGREFTIQESAIIAFEAGLTYVGHSSRIAIAPWHLQHKVKLINPKFLKKRNFKLVFTNGCFDILHTGHLAALRFAKSKGERLVVALNSDRAVAELKGDDRPIVPLEERMEVMAALEFVDYVVSFDDISPYNIIKEVGPDVLVKSYPYSPNNIIGSDIVDEVYIAPKYGDFSTTNIVDKIKRGDG